MELKRARGRFVRSLASAVGGFALYGSWGYLANRGVGVDIARRVGLLQGTFSFVVTLTSALIIEAVYARLGRVAPTVAACLAFTYALMVTVHTLVGTPHLLVTIAPGLVVTAVFVTMYTLGLARRDATVADPSRKASGRPESQSRR